jgi:hypothetical protein
MNLQPNFFATKRTFLAFIFSLLILCSKAQVSSLDFTIGPSFPIGEYASRNISSSSSGVAKAGYTANISYAHLFKKHTGIIVSLHGQRNPIDTKAFEHYLTATGYNNWNVDKASWMVVGLRGGVYGEFISQAASSLSFTGKAMVGAVYSKSPKLYGRSESSTHVAETKQTSESAVGLSFSLSGGGKYKLNKKVFLLGEAELFATPKLKFKDVTSTYGTVNFASNGFPISASQMSSTMDGKQAFTSLNLTLGIGIQL